MNMQDFKDRDRQLQITFNRGGFLWIAAFFISTGIKTAHAAVNSSWSQSNASVPAQAHVVGEPTIRSVKSSESGSLVSPFSPSSNNFALDLGQVFLMGDLSRYANSIGAQLHYTYGVSDLFAFDTSLGYSEHSDGQYSMTSALAGMRGNLSWFDKIVPYAVLGVGFYRPSYQQSSQLVTSGTTTASSLSSVLFGIHMGPGIDLQLTRSLFFGASLTLHNLFGTTRVLESGTGYYMGGAYISFFAHTGYTF